MHNNNRQVLSTRLFLVYYAASMILEAFVLYGLYLSINSILLANLLEYFLEIWKIHALESVIFMLYIVVLYTLTHLVLNQIIKSLLIDYYRYKAFQLTVLAALATYTILTIPALSTPMGSFWFITATPFSCGIIYYLLYCIGNICHRK